MSAEDQGLWLGLLKWSLAHSDGTAPSPATAMSDEDKSFLERVLREHTRNEPERMKEIILELVTFVDAATASAAASTPNEEHIENLLDELRDITEQIDMAQVFCKFGGLQCILGILENGGIGIECRSMAASVLATLAQNNMVVQDAFYNQGVVQRLSQLALASLGSETSKTFASKVMYSLSCTIRNHAAAEELFSLTYGNSFFSAALPQSPPSVLAALANLTPPNTYSTATLACMRRAVHLANALVASDSRSAPRLRHILPALVPAIFQCICLDDVDLREGTSRLLLTMLATYAGYTALTAAPHKASLLAAIERRKTITLADDDQEVHEKEIASQILVALLGSAPDERASTLQERRAAEEGPDSSEGPPLLLGSGPC